jgi:hypothetical protein
MVLATALAGCSGPSTSELFDSKSDSRLFGKSFDVFAKPQWASPAADAKSVSLGPKGPVAPEDLVGADGRCAPPTVAEAPAAQASVTAAPAADRPVGSVAGDLASAPMPAAAPAAAPPPAGLEPVPGSAPLLGGIALGMTECDTVRRAGQPSNVSIGAGDKGERKVVLTYLGGNWPGIYNFASGRLKEISAAPVPAKPAKPVKKQRPAKKTAKQAGGQVHVQ